MLCNSPDGNMFSTGHLKFEQDGRNDRRGRLLFRGLHDKVSVTATLRVVWEPIVQTCGVQTSVKMSRDSGLELDAGVVGTIARYGHCPESEEYPA